MLRQICLISIHAPSRERLRSIEYPSIEAFISIHAPSRERLHVTTPHDDEAVISIHAPSRERLDGVKGKSTPKNFNPRSLAGATVQVWLTIVDSSNFNPRSLAGATDDTAAIYTVLEISIHAPSRERQLKIKL